MNIDLDQVYIILVETKFPGNIGSAARAMKNMGLKHLYLAAPQTYVDEEAEKMAREVSFEILSGIKIFPSLEQAVEGIGFRIGTTSRRGGRRAIAYTPREIVQDVLPQYLPTSVAFIFGNEESGLANEHIQFCEALIRIPSNPEYPTLNLAQSVAIISYELFLSSKHVPHEPKFTMATPFEIDYMYRHIEETFREIEYPGRGTPIEKGVSTMRRILGKGELRRFDVRFMRGFCRRIIETSRGCRSLNHEGREEHEEFSEDED